MPQEYIVFLAQQHPTFRYAEIESLADFHNIKIDLSSHDEESPFMIVTIETEEEAKKWLENAILAKGVYELWGVGNTEEELHEDVQKRSKDKFPLYSQCSFRFDVIGYHGSRTNQEKIKMIERFSYVDFDGPIRMKNPQEIFTVLEHYEKPLDEKTKSTKLNKLYFGRQISLSARSRGVLEKYDLKKRGYIGTTTFEAELSLISCNLAQVSKGKLMYDPFAGTGSFLVAGGYFGALTVGSDIDGRMIKGKGKNTIGANFKQYGTSQSFMDVLTMDFTHNAFRSNMIIDTIVCDPPYGIREGLKVLGAKDPERFKGKEDVEINGTKAYLLRDYIPTKKPYSLDDLLYDLLEFSSQRLPIGGRLAFWMPTANDNFVETLIPQHKNLELKYHLVQEFNKWSRRLLVYINRGSEYNGVDNRAATSLPEFRQKYFRANRKSPTPESSASQKETKEDELKVNNAAQELGKLDVQDNLA